MSIVTILVLLALALAVGQAVWQLARRLDRLERECRDLAERVGYLQQNLAESHFHPTVPPLPSMESLEPHEPWVPVPEAEREPAVAAEPPRLPAEPAGVWQIPRPAAVPGVFRAADEAAPTPVPGPEALPHEGAAARSIDWERFMGARLFAWLGGLALFLGVAYFVKYSFERDLIPPSMRVLIGLVTGAGLVAGGMRLRERAYAVTSQTLSATGVVILYAALFGGHALYHLPWLPQSVTFVAMTAVTAGAFALAVRTSAQVIAVLGWVGGFLTPILLGSGEDQPGALFSYIALLDAGLLAVALWRRWDTMALLGALGTVVMQLGWLARFFGSDRMPLVWTIFTVFLALFGAALWMAARLKRDNDALGGAGALLACVALAFATWLNVIETGGMHPGWVFALVLVANLMLMSVAWLRPKLGVLQVLGGVAAFGLVALWQVRFLDASNLWWGLGLSLAFAVLHTVVPLVLPPREKVPGQVDAAAAAPFFPPLAVAVLLVALLRMPGTSFALWPVLLLLNLLAMALLTRAGGAWAAVVALVLTGVTTAVWIGRVPVGEAVEMGGTLTVVVLSAAVFVVPGLLWRRLAAGRGGDASTHDLDRIGGVPVLGAVMPFLLLAQMVAHLRWADPTAVWLILAGLAVVLLGLAAAFRLEFLPLVTAGAVSVVQHVWLASGMAGSTRPVEALAWCAVLAAGFTAYPVLSARAASMRGAWIAGAIAAIPQFHVAYRIVEHFWPNRVMGLVPLVFAIPASVLFWHLLRNIPAEQPGRLERLAWTAGSVLFLLTVALPIQFDGPVLTIAFALEGGALLALFRKVPHPGLVNVGAGLLVTVAVRLLLNPAVLEDAVRGSVPLWNEWLATYGAGAAACLLGARCLPPGQRVGQVAVRPLLVTLGVILIFALVNLEIADFFTPVGEQVEFEFAGQLGRDMTYTLAWALFALALVVSGLRARVPAARWAGLALLAVSVAKLFLSDLARLDQLYRVGALVGVALVAIAASVLYQRYAARETAATHGPGPQVTE